MVDRSDRVYRFLKYRGGAQARACRIAPREDSETEYVAKRHEGSMYLLLPCGATDPCLRLLEGIMVEGVEAFEWADPA